MVNSWISVQNKMVSQRFHISFPARVYLCNHTLHSAYHIAYSRFDSWRSLWRLTVSVLPWLEKIAWSWGVWNTRNLVLKHQFRFKFETMLVRFGRMLEPRFFTLLALGSEPWLHLAVTIAIIITFTSWLLFLLTKNQSQIYPSFLEMPSDYV